MSRLKSFFFALSMSDRDLYAERTGTPKEYVQQVAYGNKRCSLGKAVALVTWANAMGGSLLLEDIPLAKDASRQMLSIERAKRFLSKRVPPASSPAGNCDAILTAVSP